MKKGFVGVLLVLLVPVLASCGAYDAVKTGVVTGYVTNIAKLGNGASRVWMSADPNVSFCSSKPELLTQAQEWREKHTLVSLSYERIRSYDEDSFYDCMFRVVSIKTAQTDPKPTIAAQ